MIYTEIVTIRGRQFRRTYSDTYTLMRDGEEFNEAVDPLDSGRVYTETDKPLDTGTEEATVEDSQTALNEFGVKV